MGMRPLQLIPIVTFHGVQAGVENLAWNRLECAGPLTL